MVQGFRIVAAGQLIFPLPFDIVLWRVSISKRELTPDECLPLCSFKTGFWTKL